MKYMIKFFFLLISISAHGDELAMLSDLESLMWKKRIIVANDVQNESRVLALFEKNTTEIDDRDIVWLIINGNHISTNYSGGLSEGLLDNIRNRYKIGQGKTILIGKDGGVKSRVDHVDLDAIFLEIEAMPMRQREILN